MFALNSEKESPIIFEALSDPTRLAIVKMLLSKEMTADEITSKTGKARSTIERHLDSLMEAGLIERKKGEDRAYVYYATQLAKEVMRFIQQKQIEAPDVKAAAKEPTREVVVELPIKKLPPERRYIFLFVVGLSSIFLIANSFTSLPMWLLGIILGIALSIEEEAKKALSFLILSSVIISLGSVAILKGGLTTLLLTTALSFISITAIGMIFWLIGRLLRQLL
ncbi:MAG: hypothetical protein DRJ31_02415 [Candidatus Methanomethylicota archaeon]|uniref:HTH arsR-type domain-containing protein n=2 Tax=Thermoproteota archaeon TaxID=2056631 RepID=A0A497ESD2_9CREN|nr:MAG: hypothetical protein DRJ31_02415 [Candidatus Verstraetearchaeota archaeon]